MIVHGSVCAWKMNTMKHILYACIILHNMIVKDERHIYNGNFYHSYEHLINDVSTTGIHIGSHPPLESYLESGSS